MMSRGFRLDQCWRTAPRVSSLRMTPSLQQTVMAKAGVGIERDVAKDADLRHGLLIARMAWKQDWSGLSASVPSSSRKFGSV